MSDETPEKTSVSRRDFLRRAGNEAVKTTAQASPLNLARAAAGLGGKTPWWQRVAAWRKDKTEDEPESTDEKETDTPDARTDSE